MKKSDITEEYIRNNFDINKERKNKTKKITDERDILSLVELNKEYKLNDILSLLKDHIEKFSIKNNINTEDINISLSTDYYDDIICELSAFKKYTENDLEVIRRLKKREREKLTKKQLEKNKRDAEYKEFLKLKKKFEDQENNNGN